MSRASSAAGLFRERTQALLRRLKRQRPLRAGSLLITILGDAIVPRGGVIALRSLIDLARPFGLTERLVRTAIGRLANEGWVVAQRNGRSSYYSLTANGKARFAEATQRIYGAAPKSWSGEWTLVIVPPSIKQERESLRNELTWLGFGQLTSGVFVHPTHGEEVIRARLAELGSGGGLIVVQRGIVSPASAVQLVEMGWDLGELAERYRRFIDLFQPVDEALPGACDPEAGEQAFMLRTLLVHEYRRIHLRDPQLPASLLPPDWAGSSAHALCRELYSKVFAASERHLDAQARALTGALPRPSREVFSRFGGLPRVESAGERRG
ncbi:MAG TPA: phenylacetic acid degradation operon negative regulatory protein PaaX [Steroidobacter sp.]